MFTWHFPYYLNNFNHLTNPPPYTHTHLIPLKVLVCVPISEMIRVCTGMVDSKWPNLRHMPTPSTRCEGKVLSALPEPQGLRVKKAGDNSREVRMLLPRAKGRKRNRWLTQEEASVSAPEEFQVRSWPLRHSVNIRKGCPLWEDALQKVPVWVEANRWGHGLMSDRWVV